MKLTLLGTGSPVPSLKRSSADYMSRIGGDLILIDRKTVRLRILAEMQEIFKGTLIWGEDLMEFVIGDE